MVEVNGFKVEGMEFRTNSLGEEFSAYEYVPTPLEERTEKENITVRYGQEVYFEPGCFKNVSKKEPAAKNDNVDCKPDFSLLPEVFLVQVARAMMAGELKYQRHNYTQGHKICQLTAAIVRHAKRIEEGEWIDKDTTERLGYDVTHLGCIAASCLMALHQEQLGTLVDNTFKGLGL